MGLFEYVLQREDGQYYANHTKVAGGWTTDINKACTWTVESRVPCAAGEKIVKVIVAEQTVTVRNVVIVEEK